MTLQFFLNLVLIACVIGILILFLRRFAETEGEQGQGQQSLEFAEIEKRAQKPAAASESSGQMPAQERAEKNFWARFPSAALGLVKSAVSFLKKSLQALLRPVWHFMLEAKDLKQGQILASKFARMLPSKAKIKNIGAHSKIRKAERLSSEGKIGDAEQVFLEVIMQHPHEYAAYEGLVKIYLQQKKYSEVIETLEYLIKHNPENDHYYAQLGNVFMIGRRYDEAIAAYERALELNVLIPARFVNAGLCRHALGDYQGAARFFKKALELEPANVQYVLMLVDVLVKMKNSEEARKHLERAAEIDPNSALIRERLMGL